MRSTQNFLSGMSSHHLSKPLKSSPPLINNLVEGLRRSNAASDDLIFPSRQAFIRFLAIGIKRHAELAPGFLAHVHIVQFRCRQSADIFESLRWELTLHRWRRQLNHLHARATQLLTQTEHEGIQRCFGGGVRRERSRRNNCEIGTRTASVSDDAAASMIT